MAQVDLSRRTFLIGAGCLAAGVVVGAAASPQAAAADVLRPPGSLAEGQFAARCIRCERCISVCPQDILYPLGMEEGKLVVKTPAIDYAEARCTFCDKCRQVCPTAAIGSVDPLAPQQGRIGCAWVYEDRCLAFYEPGACGVCIDACEYGALSFDDERRPVVDEELCNGCGECERICPANVLTSFEGGSYRGIGVVTEAALARKGGA